MDYPFLVPLARSVKTNNRFTLEAVYDSYEKFMAYCVELNIGLVATHGKQTFYVWNPTTFEVNGLPFVVLKKLFNQFPSLPKNAVARNAGDVVALAYLDAVTDELSFQAIPIHQKKFPWGIKLTPNTQVKLARYGYTLLKKQDTIVSFTPPKISARGLSKEEIVLLTKIDDKTLVLSERKFEKTYKKETGRALGFNSSLWKNFKLSKESTIGDYVDVKKVSFKNFFPTVFFGVHKWRLGIPFTGASAVMVYPSLTDISFLPLPILGIFTLTSLVAVISGVHYDRTYVAKLNTSGQMLLKQQRGWEKFQLETGKDSQYRIESEAKVPQTPEEDFDEAIWATRLEKAYKRKEMSYVLHKKQSNYYNCKKIGY